MKVSFQAPVRVPLRDVKRGEFYIDEDGDLCVMADGQRATCFMAGGASVVIVNIRGSDEMVSIVKGPITFQPE
jgi:hypothetical protein